MILELASGNYIKQHLNIILMEASGNGKTWIPNAFGVRTCLQNYKVKYVLLPHSLYKFRLTKNETDHSFHRLIKNYKKVDLLSIDEWLLTPLPDVYTFTPFEIIELYLKTDSTLFCSQTGPEESYNKLDKVLVADAILDRINCPLLI